MTGSLHIYSAPTCYFSVDIAQIFCQHIVFIQHNCIYYPCLD